MTVLMWLVRDDGTEVEVDIDPSTLDLNSLAGANKLTEAVREALESMDEEDEGPSFTEAERKAVTEVLGGFPDNERIAEAVGEHEATDNATLRRQLAGKVRQFNRQGGRGVELADEIDSLRITLAIRKVRKSHTP